MSARSIRNAVTAVVLTAALATAGTACGSGDGASGERDRKPDVAAAATPEAGEPEPSAGENRKERRPEKPEGPEKDGEHGRADNQPTVPKAELTPATGSFTTTQKKYLVDRVPRGTDPAAVLEAGQAVCDRLSRTAEVDRKAAISALKSGEIADAEAPVTHLCPKHQPLLEAAGLTGG